MKRFYACLEAGEEYSDDAWREWQTKHPSLLQEGPPAPSSQPQQGAGNGRGYGRGGGGGRGNCFKCGGLSLHIVSAVYRPSPLCFYMMDHTTRAVNIRVPVSSLQMVISEVYVSLVAGKASQCSLPTCDSKQAGPKIAHCIELVIAGAEKQGTGRAHAQAQAGAPTTAAVRNSPSRTIPAARRSPPGHGRPAARAWPVPAPGAAAASRRTFPFRTPGRDRNRPLPLRRPAAALPFGMATATSVADRVTGPANAQSHDHVLQSRGFVLCCSCSRSML